MGFGGARLSAGRGCGCGLLGSGDVFGAAGRSFDGGVEVFQDADFLFVEKAPVATLDVLFREAGIHDAVEASYIVAQVLEDAADDPVAAAMDFNTDLCLVFWFGIGEVVDGCGAVFKGDGAGGDLFEVGFCQGFVEGDVVDLSDLVAGVGELLGQVAVVGEEQDAGGVAVEAADGEDAFGCCGADEVKYGAAALGVVSGRDIVFRFVKKDIDEVIRDRDFFVVDLDGVGGMDFCSGFGDECAVDGDFTLADEFGGVAAGADAAVGDVFVEGECFGRGAFMGDRSCGA